MNNKSDSPKIINSIIKYDCSIQFCVHSSKAVKMYTFFGVPHNRDIFPYM